tara:strand:+ start:452 stop:733 length:282 start_codon:yes stop_codon:yes gene_type:complete
MECLASETIQKIKTDPTEKLFVKDELVSFIQEIPDYLKKAMSEFMDKYPNWDQYRLMEAAISGYLLEKGVESREINSLYFKSMFCKKAFGQSL